MRRSNTGYTLMELLVSCGVILILAAVLFPVISAAKKRAMQASCMSQENQIAKALLMYRDDSGEFPGGNWCWLIQSYLGMKQPADPEMERHHDRRPCPLLDIPLDDWMTVNPFTGYATNACLSAPGPGLLSTGSSTVMDVGRTVLIAETGPAMCRGGWMIHASIWAPDSFEGPLTLCGGLDGEIIPPAGDRRHYGGANYVFLDGHSHWYRPTDFMIRDTTANAWETPCAPKKVSGRSDGPTFATSWRQQ